MRGILIGFMLLVGAAALAANLTVIVGGKTISVPVVVVNGKQYIDLNALTTALSGFATFDAATGKLVFTAPSSGINAPGTAQMAGENGELGTVYAIRKGNPLYFCLKSAEFTTKQVLIGNELFVPTFNEKLLLLRFTVQNPNKVATHVRWDSLRFTAVDAMNVNHAEAYSWGDVENQQPVNIDLKPAQKIEAYRVLRVPAKGLVPKLIIESGVANDGPVLRYDLREKVAPLIAPFADPTDPTGATALSIVPAELGTAYPYRYFAVAVEKIESVTTALQAGPPEAGGRYLLVTVAITNATTGPRTLRSDTLMLSLTSTDNEPLRFRVMLLATANRLFEAQAVPAGQTVKARLCFFVPKDVTPQTLTLKEADSRTYTYAVKE